MKFAKLYEVGIDQVLLLRQYDSDTDEERNTLITHVNGIEVSMCSTHKTKEAADKFFDGYELSTAKLFHQYMKENVSSLPTLTK